jgi:prepilin-type N-terminal cleavage/methylation domain-containing protein
MRRASPSRRFLLRKRRRDRRDRGFTLVEVVVAIAILALMAGVIFRVNSDSIRNIRRADALTNQSALAQSLIAKVGTEIPLREGEARGQTNAGLQWRVQMKRYGDTTDRAQWPLAAYTVMAEVTLRDGPDSQPVALMTLRLGPKEAAP